MTDQPRSADHRPDAPGPDDRVGRAPPRLPGPSVTLPGARRSPWGGLVSLLLHLGVVALILVAQYQELMTWEEILGPGEGPGQSGGGGGGGIQAIAIPRLQAATPPATADLPPPPPPPVEPEPVPDPVAPVEPDVEAAPTPADTVPPSGGQGGPGSGGGRGSGVGTGDGSGTGPGSGSGSGGGTGTGGGGGKATPPMPRQVILPPLDYPGDLRGKTFAVTFWVGTDGRVQRVAVDPEIPDGGFARRFEDVMRNYRFRPARAPDGKPMPGTTTVRVSF